MANVTTLGRVRPGVAAAYDAGKTYEPLDRVTTDGLGVFECVQTCAANEGPSQAPEKWIVVDAGITPEEVSALLSDVTTLQASVASKQDAAQASADKAALAAELDKKANSVAMAAELDKKAVKTDVDKALASKANSSDVYTKTQVDTSLAAKVNTAAMNAELAKYLPLTGGTLTGNLLMQKSGPRLRLRNNSIDFNILPEAYLSTNIYFETTNSDVYYNLGCDLNNDGSIQAYMKAYNHDSAGKELAATIGTMIPKSGAAYSYVTAAPRENAYANDIDTLRASVNRHPIKLAATKTVHVGGSNASDTADLFMGRGESANKPFATLDAAVLWATTNFCGIKDINIILNSDITITSRLYLNTKSVRRIIITAGSKKTINLNGGCIICNGGSLEIGPNIKAVASNGAPYMFGCDGYYEHCNLILNGVELEGDVTQSSVFARLSGTVSILNDLTGSVTGKRYSCTEGGRIFTGGRGPNAIPGSVAGTCDASSTYA